jgi:undecaprenyl-diphosphatase
MLVIAGAVLWLADRWGPRTHTIDRLTFRAALGIGLAQAIALVPGVSRSGISISAGLFAGLDRQDAARYSFLMATPIIAGAVLYEGVKLARGDNGVSVELLPLVVGIGSAFIAGAAAIAVLLRYVRSRSYNAFVLYRIALAIVVLGAFLAR